MGNTKKEAMASIIMLSDMTLGQKRNRIIMKMYCIDYIINYSLKYCEVMFITGLRTITIV